MAEYSFAISPNPLIFQNKPCSVDMLIKNNEDYDMRFNLDVTSRNIYLARNSGSIYCHNYANVTITHLPWSCFATDQPNQEIKICIDSRKGPNERKFIVPYIFKNPFDDFPEWSADDFNEACVAADTAAHDYYGNEEGDTEGGAMDVDDVKVAVFLKGYLEKEFLTHGFLDYRLVPGDIAMHIAIHAIAPHWFHDDGHPIVDEGFHDIDYEFEFMLYEEADNICAARNASVSQLLDWLLLCLKAPASVAQAALVADIVGGLLRTKHWDARTIVNELYEMEASLHHRVGAVVADKVPAVDPDVH